MEALSRIVERAGAALIVIAVAGCAGPEPVAAPAVEHSREVLVQSIPREGYVVRDQEYIGVAPVAVAVRTDGRGHPLRETWIKVTDTGSGAWRRELLSPLRPVPERMLLDVREFMVPAPALSWR